MSRALSMIVCGRFDDLTVLRVGDALEKSADRQRL